MVVPTVQQSLLMVTSIPGVLVTMADLDMGIIQHSSNLNRLGIPFFSNRPNFLVIQWSEFMLCGNHVNTSHIRNLFFK